VPSAAVGGSPSATDGENFAVCLLSLCRVLGAHGELANSGSAGVQLGHCYVVLVKLNCLQDRVSFCKKKHKNEAIPDSI